jgi:hypothetical protein
VYLAYGIAIQSDLPLPELPPAGAVPAQLVVRRSRVSVPSGMAADERRAWSENGTAWLFCRRRGALRVSNGKEILVEAAPGADDRIVRNWIVGQGLGIAMVQRGLLVLHASVVESGGNGVAFVGGSGAGKSTIAMAFCRSGDRLVADDQAVIAVDDGAVTVLAGFPQLKLHRDALRDLEDAEGAVATTPVSEEKLGWTVRQRFASRAVPLRRIYVLAEDRQWNITPLPVQEAANALVEYSFLSSLLIKPASMGRHRLRCVELAERVPVRRLTRPRTLSELPELTRRVREQNESGAP